MNSVLVLFVLFTLGLQDFNRDNGIAANLTDSQFALKNAVNAMINKKEGARNQDYVGNNVSEEGLKNLINNHFNGEIRESIKRAAIYDLDTVNTDAARAIKNYIEGNLTVIQTRAGNQTPPNFLQGAPPSG